LKEPFDGEKADVFALAIILFSLQYFKEPIEISTNYKIFCEGNYDRFFPEEPIVP
jgi:hypothetical protein